MSALNSPGNEPSLVARRRTTALLTVMDIFPHLAMPHSPPPICVILPSGEVKLTVAGAEVINSGPSAFRTALADLPGAKITLH